MAAQEIPMPPATLGSPSAWRIYSKEEFISIQQPPAWVLQVVHDFDKAQNLCLPIIRDCPVPYESSEYGIPLPNKACQLPDWQTKSRQRQPVGNYLQLLPLYILTNLSHQKLGLIRPGKCLLKPKKSTDYHHQTLFSLTGRLLLMSIHYHTLLPHTQYFEC